jgi:ribose 1,5-bisphosphokinase
MSGALIAVFGPSGAGKDALIAYLRQRLGPVILVAHRYITRPQHPGEDHVALTPAEFAARAAQRLFAIAWTAHGSSYGVGIELDAWLASGMPVIISVSRTVLGGLAGRYPTLLPVQITAPAELRASRLARRARPGDDPAGRLEREVRLPELPGLLTIVNEGDLAEAGSLLLTGLAERCPQLIGSAAQPGDGWNQQSWWSGMGDGG